MKELQRIMSKVAGIERPDEAEVQLSNELDSTYITMQQRIQGIDGDMDMALSAITGFNQQIDGYLKDLEKFKNNVITELDKLIKASQAVSDFPEARAPIEKRLNEVSEIRKGIPKLEITAREIYHKV